MKDVSNIVAADLSTPERILLFCLASGTEWAEAGVTGATVTSMLVRGRRRAAPLRSRRRRPCSPLLGIRISWGPWGAWDRAGPSGIGRHPEIPWLSVLMGPSGLGA